MPDNNSKKRRREPDTKADTKPDITKPPIKHEEGGTRQMGSTGSRAWTGEEYLLIFDAVADRMRSKVAFEGVVPGRNAQQAYDAWRTVVKNTCRRALMEKGGEKRL